MAEKDVVMVRRLTLLQRLGLSVLLVFGALLISGAIFIWSGLYNVSASRDHLSITTWIITVLRDQSISVRAASIEAPDLSDDSLAALGAEHYRTGCIECHGTPGEQINPIYENMLPSPPDLTFAPDDYSPEALYWIIHSGLKYTGMPGWPSEERTDEVWALVAFLERLHQEGPQSFDEQLSQPQAAAAVDTDMTIANCVRCHGNAETPPISDRVPSLNGQSEPYLIRALEEYRDETRPSGFMAPVAYEMSDDDIAALADYYAGLAPIRSDTSARNTAMGERIFLEGLPEADVPACVSCHAGADPQFPLLQGQSATYLRGQLEIWRRGLRDETTYGSIMAEIAQRLSPEQVTAVSQYLAAQPAAVSAAEP